MAMVPDRECRTPILMVSGLGQTGRRHAGRDNAGAD